jgi:ribonuclease E
MEENRNDRSVEKRMKDALRFDRARVQMGKISSFGLLEISRQRRRTGVLEGSSHICAACDGIGRVRSPESASLQALRAVEAAVANRRDCEVALHADLATALYLLNEKRDHLSRLFTERGLVVRVFAESDMNAGQYRFEIVEAGEDVGETEFVPVFVKIEDPIEEDDELIDADDAEMSEEDNEDGETTPRTKSETLDGDNDSETDGNGNKRRRRRRRGRRDEVASSSDGETISVTSETTENGDNSITDETEESDDEVGPDGETAAEAQARRRRRRGRRGGRRRREGETARVQGAHDEPSDPIDAGTSELASPSDTSIPEPIVPGMETMAAEETTPEDQLLVIEAIPEAEAPPKRKRPTRKKKADDVVEDTQSATAKVTAEESIVVISQPQAEPEVTIASEATTVEAEVTSIEEGPKRSGWWSRNAKKLFGAGDPQ